MHTPILDGTETAHLHDSGLIERFRFGDGIMWSLTSTAINKVLDAETALQLLLQEVVSLDTALTRYTVGIGLLYDLDLQRDVDGVWHAIDHARYAIDSRLVGDQDVEAFATATGLADRPDMGLEQAMMAVAVHPDRAVRQWTFNGLVRLIRREGETQAYSVVAQYLKGII